MTDIHAIQTEVCRRFDVHPIVMVSKRTSQAESIPRQVAMYLCRRLTSHSLPTIGRAFGNRDHTTVLYACRTTEERMAFDPELAAKVSDIRAHFDGEGDT